MKPIKVFSHKSPDTDATGSAILWAWYLTDVMSQSADAYVLGELNKETLFVLNKWAVAQPKVLESLEAGDKVVIVDTNNPDELPANITDAQIMQIIDHHMLVGGLSTKSPIEVTMRPLACTATVIYDLMGQAAEAMPNSMRGIMLSCILSDTLEFRSPTTTPHDKAVAEKLAKDLGIDISSYAAEMFAAKSDVSDYTDAALLTTDSKVFDVGGKKIRISVVETTNPSSIIARKEGIVAAIESMKGEEASVDDILFFVVDILKEEATVFTYNELTKQIIEKSFNVSIPGDTATLFGVVSRKKQIVPALKI